MLELVNLNSICFYNKREEASFEITSRRCGGVPDALCIRISKGRYSQIRGNGSGTRLVDKAETRAANMIDGQPSAQFGQQQQQQPRWEVGGRMKKRKKEARF